MRIGCGYDIHRLVSDRKLVLGGVEIPFGKGLLGHSDADVLTHAICDALLGACGEGDIGEHFPDSALDYKNIFSITLLKKTSDIVKKKGFGILNLDATIFAEAPKLSSFKKKMEKNIAEAIIIDYSRVNIKATTTEGLGVIGKGEGIGAMCVALLAEKTKRV